MSQIAANVYKGSANPDAGKEAAPLDRTAKLSMRTRTFAAKTVGECLQLAKQELGVEAMIISKRTFRKGAWFGKWGGREMVEVTFGTYRPSPSSNGSASITFSHGAPAPEAPKPTAAPDAGPPLAAPAERARKPEASLDAFVAAPIDARPAGIDAPAPKPEAAPAPKSPRRSRAKVVEPLPANAATGPYPALMRQLLDNEVAEPLARQLIAQVPEGLSGSDAVSALRTAISQRLLIANRIRTEPGAAMRLLAFMGTTGVGKTTTIAKIAAQYALMERRRVGIVTLDTYRIAAAQQLETYGKILKVPVLIARDRIELHEHIQTFKVQGMEMVLMDTAGRSPNDMLPLGETLDLFDGLGPVQKFLAVPATLSARDMENIVARFQSILAPDALVLTKLDEATDNSCFGKVLSVQARHGLPLAYVTTGQRVPDDITFPDAHTIAARLLTTALL